VCLVSADAFSSWWVQLRGGMLGPVLGLDDSRQQGDSCNVKRTIVKAEPRRLIIEGQLQHVHVEKPSSSAVVASQ